MYQLYRNYMRLTFRSTGFRKSNVLTKTRSHLHMSCYQAVDHFAVSSERFDYRNTPAELKSKLQKLNIKCKEDLNFTPYSLTRILQHPCFDASHISKEEGHLLLKSCQLINDTPPETRVSYIWDVWQALKERNIVDLNSYHYLLLAFLRSGAKVDVNRALESLRNSGYTPTTQTYNLLLQFISENGNFDDVQAIISKMTEEGHEIDDEGMCAVVYAITKCRGLDDAMEYIRASALEFSSRFYVSLLRSVAEASDLLSFNRLFVEARKNGVEFRTDDRISIVESLIKGNLISVIPDVLGEKTNWKSKMGALCNLCVRCMHSKRYDVAKMILNYAPEFLEQQFNGCISRTPITYAEYLTTEMVKSKMPLNDILRFCCEDNFIVRLKNAAYTSLRHRVFHYSLDLFETMKQNDLPVRPHYFWPILLASKDEKSVFGLLSAMKALEVKPDFYTLYEYVYPYINHSTCDDTLQKLKQVDITDEDSVTPLIAFLLTRGRFSDIIELSELKYGNKKRRIINCEPLYPILATTVVKTRDFESVVRICRNFDFRLVSVFHYVLYNHRNEADPEVVEKFLNFFSENKIALFQADLEGLKTYFDAHNITDISLDNFVNEVNDKTQQNRPHLRDMNIEELEKYVVHLKNNNYRVRQALRRLLIMYADVGNYDKVLEIKKELEEHKFKFSIGMKVASMMTFCKINNFDEAYKIFIDLKRNNELEELSFRNIITLAIAAAKKENLEIMYEVLQCRNVTKDEAQSPKHCVNLIKTVTECHGYEATNKLFKFLVDKGYCTVNAQLLGPIIKEFLSRQDVERAALACLDFGSQYRILPMRNVILSALASLAVEEKTLKKEPKFELLLNKFLQMSSYLYGQNYTNITYAICLAETGMLATLRSFLMDSYTGTEKKTMWRECNKLADENKLQTLLALESVFKDMRHYDMEPIYINLLKIYVRSKDRESAEKLLKSLENSNRVPSETFLNMYAELQNLDEKT